jgi:hypothetical protein
MSAIRWGGRSSAHRTVRYLTFDRTIFVKQTRRQFLKTTALASAAFGLAPALPAFAESVDLEELLIPGPLGDKILGDENANMLP